MSEPVIAGKAAEILTAWRTLCAAVLSDPAQRTPLESAIPHLLDAVEAGLARHKGSVHEDYPQGQPMCAECGEWSPCPTEQAITTALLGGTG